MAVNVVCEDRVELLFALDEELAEYFCLEIDPLRRVLDYRDSHYSTPSNRRIPAFVIPSAHGLAADADGS